MRGSHLDRDCSIGLILGTGSNACFLEAAARAKHSDCLTHGEKEVRPTSRKRSVDTTSTVAFGKRVFISFMKIAMQNVLAHLYATITYDL